MPFLRAIKFKGVEIKHNPGVVEFSTTFFAYILDGEL